MKKGYYIRSNKDKSLNLFISKEDFIKYLESLEDSDGWVRFRIYERNEVDPRGYTHNMEQLINNKINNGND